MSKNFLKPKFLGENVKVQLDLPAYATNVDIKMQEVLIHQILLKRMI